MRPRALTVVGLLAGGLALSAGCARTDGIGQRVMSEQERAIAAIDAGGGRFGRDEKAPGKPITAIVIEANADPLMPHVRAFPKLRLLAVRSAGLTDAGLNYVEDLTGLDALNVSHNKLTDAGMEHLKGLTRLSRLLLDGNAITDAGLARLKGLTKLQALALDDTKVTDAGVIHLEAFAELHELALMKCQISDAGLAPLGRMTELRELNLADTLISDTGVEHLRGLKHLQYPVADPHAHHKQGTRARERTRRASGTRDERQRDYRCRPAAPGELAEPSDANPGAHCRDRRRPRASQGTEETSHR